MKSKALFKSPHYTVVSAQHIASRPIVSDDPHGSLYGLWCGFFEELRSQGLRPLHVFTQTGAVAVLCESEEQGNAKAA